MEYVYGALVLHSAGKPVNEENLKKVLTAAGVKVDETRVKALTAALEMPTAAPAAAPPPEKKEEKKKEEKKEEEKVSEEEAAAGLGALFGEAEDRPHPCPFLGGRAGAILRRL